MTSLLKASLAAAVLSLAPIAASADDTLSLDDTSMMSEVGVTSEQAGRIVLQDGEAIGTLLEVAEDDNAAVIALMDGSEKQVALADLSLAEDGSVVLSGWAGGED